MLQVTDIRQTRVFQEARAEGHDEGIEKGREEGIEAVARRLLEMGRPLTEVAVATGLSESVLRKLIRKPKRN